MMPDTDSAEVFDVVHARLLRFFPELVAELGGNPARLLQAVGIDPDDHGRAGATYRQTIGLMELAAAQLGCPDFGMRLAKRQTGASLFGPLGLVMKNSRTFGDALDYVSKHTYAHSLAARVWQKRLKSEGMVFSGHDILLDRIPVKTQAMEQILLIGHFAAMEITGGRARVRRAHFRHQPVSPPTTYRSYFGCEVRFGQNEDGVVFSERDLACPIVAPDLQAYRRMTAFIDVRFTRHRPPLRAQARGVITQLLGTERCSNDQVAAELNLHPRTLHRRLKAEGTSFQHIKDEVRRDVMLYYVQQTDFDFARISEKLGFAEQSVMTRSCNRWFAASPTRMRFEAQRDLAKSVKPDPAAAPR
jgi:AraC-like DNA-binding protein